MNSEFSKDQVVWGKVSGYPWWPGFISAVLGQDSFEVVFFGDFSRAYLCSSKIKKFDAHSEKAQKANKRFQSSLKMAQRIVEGGSTIAFEHKQAVEQQAKKPVFAVADPINKCTRKQSLSLAPCNETEAQIKEPRGKLDTGAIARRFSELQNQSAVCADEEFPGQVSFSQPLTKGINSADDNSKDLQLAQSMPPLSTKALEIDEGIAPKQSEANQPAEENPLESSNANSKPKRFFKSRKSLPNINESFLSDLKPDQSIGQKLEFQKPKTTSSFKTMSFTAEQRSNIVKYLEQFLEDIWLSLRESTVDLNSTIGRLKEWHIIFIQEQQHILPSNECRIGSFWNLIHHICCSRLSDSPRYQTMLEEVWQIRETIEKSLLESFFRLTEEQKELLSRQKGISLKQAERRTIELVKDLKSKSGVLAMKAENELAIEEELCPEKEQLAENGKMEIEAELPVESKKIEEMGLVSGKTVFRVCKKLARILHAKKRSFVAKKEICEKFSDAIESAIRGFSKNDREYQKHVCKLINYMQKDCYRFFTQTFACFEEGIREELSILLQSFIACAGANKH